MSEPSPGNDDRLVAGARVLTEPTTSEAGPGRRPTAAGCDLLEGEVFPGGLAVVHKAYHPLLKDFRAIKRPKTATGPNREILLARFRREVEVVGGLRHDHVVRAHDAGADAEGPYLVMEWLDGAPLSLLVQRHRPLPAAEACELIRQAALGLQAAHERGVVHRDVKPSNLMLARVNSGAARVVVIDWGLAKRAGEGGAQPADVETASGVGMGTADYIAPEQVRDAAAVDTPADVYSLGATLYCLLAGRPPFHGRPNLEKLLAHQREPFPPLERSRPDISRELLSVLQRMVEKDPARRYATPGDAAAALRPFCGDATCLLALLDGKDAPATPGPVRSRRRIGWLAAASAGFLLLGAAVLVGLLIRGLLSWGQGKPDDRRAPVAPAVLGEGPATPVSLDGLHPGYCSSLVFLPDGWRAVSESGGGGVYVWDLKTRRLVKSWLHGLEQPERNQDSGGLVAASPDGKLLAAAAINVGTGKIEFLSLYDQTTYQRTGDDYPFFPLGPALAFSPDGARLAVVELPSLFDGLLGPPKVKVDLVDIKTGKWAKYAGAAPVNCLAFSPDGQILATGDDARTIRLRSLQENRPEREFHGHAGAVDQVAFSADGKRLFSASSADGTLRVWDNDSDGKDAGKELTQVSAGQGRGAMICAAFWPGGWALTGHANGDVVLWDLTTGGERKRWTHKDARPTAVAVSPDGCHALTALSDHHVYLYELPERRARRDAPVPLPF